MEKEKPENTGITGGGCPSGFLNSIRCIFSPSYVEIEENGWKISYKKIRGRFFEKKRIYLSKC